MVSRTTKSMNEKDQYNIIEQRHWSFPLCRLNDAVTKRNNSRDIRGRRLSSLVITRRKSSGKVKPIRTYQPTFRLQPKIKFSSEIVEKLLQRLVPVDLEEVEYSDKGIPELCLSLSESIKDAVKELNFDRYRIIVSVTMGQKRQQSVQMFHSFLWDVDKDSFASFNYENCHIFVNVIVYGVYLD